MRAIVFSGPSISRYAVEALNGVEWRPPMSQGDVYQAVQTSPDVIAIIDGYFEGVPSVWYKEILWAMSRGIHVLGAGSMGALRAAELHQFGMRGVGKIFEYYVAGILEDDDEVAVLHGPAELGYVPLSVPMVNVRATISNAVAGSVISESDEIELIAAAKSIFYKQRQWTDIIVAAKKTGIGAAALAAFECWLPKGKSDLKQQDARALLAELSRFLASDAEPLRCDYSFEWTVMWDSMAAGRAGKSPKADTDTGPGVDRLVLDELRLAPQHYKKIGLRAQLKQLALLEAGRKRIAIDDAQTGKLLNRLRQSLDLYSRAQLDTWIEKNDWTPEALQQVLEDEQRYQTITNRMGDTGDRLLLDELRLGGEYGVYKERAEVKRAVRLPATTGYSVTPAQLLVWYFETQLCEPVPANLDEYLSELGIRKREEFYRLLEKQYHFVVAMKSE